MDDLILLTASAFGALGLFGLVSIGLSRAKRTNGWRLAVGLALSCLAIWIAALVVADGQSHYPFALFIASPLVIGAIGSYYPLRLNARHELS
jgi:hypothetical protein